MEVDSMSVSTVFTIWFGLSELVGCVMLALMGIWLGHYRGGFSWKSNPQKEFNWHPLLMTAGMILLYGNGILIYRALRNVGKKYLKFLHAVIHISIFITTVIGLKAAFDSHNLASPPIPNLYSLHSLFGLIAVILFVAQWVAGFVFFLYPKLGAPLRAAYLPLHVNVGRDIFVLVCVTALLGLVEKIFFSVPNYSKRPAEAYLANAIGFVIICYMACVLYLVSLSKYKRQPMPEDEMLLTAQKSGHHGHHGDYPASVQGRGKSPSRVHSTAPQNRSNKSRPMIKLKPFETTTYYY